MEILSKFYHSNSVLILSILIFIVLIFLFRQFTLFFIAWILLMVLTFINYILVIFKYKKGYKKYFINTALNLDKFGNREFRTLWNTVFRKNSGYPFGHPEETISGVLGKNKRDNTLTTFGKLFSKFLDTLDKNHCINSIDNKINHKLD